MRVAAVTVLALGVGATNAATVAPVYTGTYVDMYLKQNTFPSPLDEQKIYLDKDKSPTITGHVGSQTGTPLVMFSSATDTLDAANGFANITSTDGAINNITITAPGYWFSDLIFGVQLSNSTSDLHVTANDKSGASETFSSWTTQTDWGSGLNTILALSTGANLMQSVTIDSNDGFDALALDALIGVDQVKHFEISGLTAVPVPAAIWLFGSGLIGLIGVARRKSAV